MQRGATERGLPGFHDGCMIPITVRQGGQNQIDRDSTGTLAENCDTAWISAEGGDVVVAPLEGEMLIKKAEILLRFRNCW